MMSFEYKKKFGQNFLTFVPQEIFIPDDLLRSFRKLTIVEIGTGLGALTKEIAQHYSFALEDTKIEYHCIDIDDEALDLLKEEVKKIVAPNVKFFFHNEDVLKVILHEMTEETEALWVIGSLPYNISKKIVNWLFEQLTTISVRAILPVKFIIQKEVAEHYVDSKNTRDFLSHVMSMYATNAKIAKILMPGSFVPAPDVVSALMEFIPKRITQEEFVKKEQILSFIRQCYTYRRKKLKQFLTKKLGVRRVGIMTEQYPSIKKAIEGRPDEVLLEEYNSLFSACTNLEEN